FARWRVSNRLTVHPPPHYHQPGRFVSACAFGVKRGLPPGTRTHLSGTARRRTISVSFSAWRVRLHATPRDVCWRFGWRYARYAAAVSPESPPFASATLSGLVFALVRSVGRVSRKI